VGVLIIPVGKELPDRKLPALRIWRTSLPGEANRSRRSFAPPRKFCVAFRTFVGINLSWIETTAHRDLRAGRKGGVCAHQKSPLVGGFRPFGLQPHAPGGDPTKIK
jgi:hypothetical protein